MRLDGVVTLIDADAMVKYPPVGHTMRMQIEAADPLILNKVDLVSESELKAIEEKLHSLSYSRGFRVRADKDDMLS